MMRVMTWHVASVLLHNLSSSPAISITSRESLASSLRHLRLNLVLFRQHVLHALAKNISTIKSRYLKNWSIWLWKFGKIQLKLLRWIHKKLHWNQFSLDQTSLHRSSSASPELFTRDQHLNEPTERNSKMSFYCKDDDAIWTEWRTVNGHMAIKHHEHWDYHQQRKLIALTNFGLRRAWNLNFGWVCRRTKSTFFINFPFLTFPLQAKLKWVSETTNNSSRYRVLWTFCVLVRVKWLRKINKTRLDGH